MAKKYPGIPQSPIFKLSKDDLLNSLEKIDSCSETRSRILKIENELEKKISSHINSMVASCSNLKDFNTSPYVVLIHAKKRNYSTIRELENDILPAKEFSSMETAAGKMIEDVLLPVYGWETVPSGMHSVYSSIDGKKIDSGILHLTTLKSGPRCLNDEMSENFADNIINNFPTWASDSNVKHIEFTYGVLYGTQRQSNKKDWHMLRKIKEKLRENDIIINPDGNWNCKFKKDGITVNVHIRIGCQWWEHLGGKTCTLELASALIRSCINANANLIDKVEQSYSICDLEKIVSTKEIPDNYNVSILQKNQLPWLFFFMYHFCDQFE